MKGVKSETIWWLKGWGAFILMLLHRKGQQGLVTERIISKEIYPMMAPECCVPWMVVKQMYNRCISSETVDSWNGAGRGRIVLSLWHFEFKVLISYSNKCVQFNCIQRRITLNKSDFKYRFGTHCAESCL